MTRQEDIHIRKKFADPGVIEDFPELKYGEEEEELDHTIPGTTNQISVGATSGRVKERE